MKSKTKTKKVSAFEAKTKLAELTRMTEEGASFIICRRGKEVARLVPPEGNDRAPDFKKIGAAFRELRSGIGKRLGGNVSIRDLIEEGRRF